MMLAQRPILGRAAAAPCARRACSSSARWSGACSSSNTAPRRVVFVRSSSAQVSQDVAQAQAPVKTDIRELNKDDFYVCLEEAGDTLVVVDFYTDWCGPCKMIYPELVKMAGAYEGRALFTKLNCNKSNKELGVKLAIKVAPTFHLYKNSQKVAEMTGAKVDKLKALIEANL